MMTQPPFPAASDPTAWPPPADSPPRPRRRTAAVIIAAAAAGTLLGGIGAAVYLLADSDPRSPEETVLAYYEARREGDCDRVIDLFTTRSWNPSGSITRPEAVAECERAMSFFVEMSDLSEDDIVEDIRVTGEGDTVTVAVVRIPSSTPTWRDEEWADQTGRTTLYELRQEDGNWRIHVPEGIGLGHEYGAWPY